MSLRQVTGFVYRHLGLLVHKFTLLYNNSYLLEGAMKKILLIALLLSLGFSQKLTEDVETYDNGNVKSITYHKKKYYIHIL